MEKLSVIGKLAAISLLAATSIQAVSAHPGRTAADGCHYCRTNCDKWGVPWNERHCHHHEDRTEILMSALSHEDRDREHNTQQDAHETNQEN